MPEQHTKENFPSGGGMFPSTHWSMVLRAGSNETTASHQALSRLCEQYWYPLYVYVRRKGNRHAEAQDLTQGFFEKLFKGDFFTNANPSRGRFRSFLLTSMTNFLANKHQEKMTQKRGEGKISLFSEMTDAEQRYELDPSHKWTADVAFERTWALSVLQKTLDKLKKDWTATGREKQFSYLEVFLTGTGTPPTYLELAQKTGNSVASLKMAVSRLRNQFRRTLCEEISHTVEKPEDADDEIRHLMKILATPPQE